MHIVAFGLLVPCMVVCVWCAIGTIVMARELTR